MGGKASRRVRAFLSVVCWILAVIAGIATAAFLVSPGFACQGQHRTCVPQWPAVVLGLAVTIGLGVVAAKLHTPAPRDERRKPWEYPR